MKTLLTLLLFSFSYLLAEENTANSSFRPEDWSTLANPSDQLKRPDITSGRPAPYESGGQELPSVPSDPEYWTERERVTKEIGRIFQEELNQYCGKNCFLSDIQPWIVRSYDTEHPDIGFESLQEKSTLADQFQLIQADLTILVNQRYGKENLKKLGSIFEILIQKQSYPIHIAWKLIEFPSEDHLAWLKQAKQLFRQKVQSEIDQTLQEYCGKNCLIQRLKIFYEEKDTVESDADFDFLMSPDGQTQLEIQQLQVQLAINENLGAEEAERIAFLLSERLKKFHHSPDISLSLTPFPQKSSERTSPVEEIFSPITQSPSKWASILTSWTLIGVLTLLFLILFYFFILPLWARKNQRIQQALKEAQEQGLSIPEKKQILSPQVLPITTQGEEDLRFPKPKLDESILLRNLKNEIIEVFMEYPAAARLIFSQMLKEDQLNQVALYGTILGEIIVFDMVNDVSLKNELNSLAEILSRSSHKIPIQEQINLLQDLQVKIIGAKVKLLSSQGEVNFGFITSKTPEQIYELIHDESPMVQSIILTELNSEKRSAFFLQMAGPTKTAVIKELTRNIRVSKDYLVNLAEALHRKSILRPGFDSEAIAGISVIEDVLVKSNYEAQRALFRELDINHPETAKTLRSQLVTPSVLTQLNETALLDLLLALDREVMLQFLGGTSTQLQKFILDKCPEEFADTLRSEIATSGKIKYEDYRIAQEQVIVKIRYLTQNGIINLYEANRLLFPEQPDLETESELKYSQVN